MSVGKPAVTAESAKRLFWVLISAIFVGETLVMLFLDRLLPLSKWGEALLDATLLSALVFPVLYFFVLRPLMVYITEHKRVEAGLRIAAVAFEAQEGILITDARATILRVNTAFTGITGYSAAEAVGQTPRLLSSGRHDARFYADMWATIRRTGSWQGEVWNRRKNGEAYIEWLTITAVRGDDAEITHYVGMQTDITQRKAAEEEVVRLAFYDPLTGLPNRRLLLDRLQHALVTGIRSQRLGALMFIDLDNFKTLNDTHGHHVGDQLLQQVAQRLQACVRESDTVARLGGDEFVLVLENLSEGVKNAVDQIEAVGEKVQAALNLPYLLAGNQHLNTPSIGIALFGEQAETVDELLGRADSAMYQSKAAGRNSLHFYDPDMQAAAKARIALEAELRQGLSEVQFVLYYQPQVDAAGSMTGVEALLRWQHPVRGLVYPNDFIPLAEETGLILPLGLWVLETACAQLVSWQTDPEKAQLSVSVNVSSRQMHQADFVDQVLAVLDRSGANPARIKLELTESLLLQDIEGTIAKMTKLKARGVSFALDDFGTGYSSLSYLKRLPVDQLKIDYCFVRDVLTDPNDATIARTILDLGKSMGLTVIAEGVETEAQRAFLSQQGCIAYQGYLFGRPGPVETLQAASEETA